MKISQKGLQIFQSFYFKKKYDALFLKHFNYVRMIDHGGSKIHGGFKIRIRSAKKGSTGDTLFEIILLICTKILSFPISL